MRRWIKIAIKNSDPNLLGIQTMTATIYNLDDYRERNDSTDKPPRRCSHCGRRAPADMTDEDSFFMIFVDATFCDIHCLNAYREK